MKVRAKDKRAAGTLVERVDIGEEQISIVLHMRALADTLLGSRPTEPGCVVLTSQVRLVRTAMAMRLFQSGSKGAVPKDADCSMVDRVTKARKWWKRSKRTV